MAATIFSSAIFITFLALTSAILSGKYHDSSAICKGSIGKQLCFDLIVNRRKLHRLPVPTRPICVWQKHGEICFFLPFSHQDITIAMDIEIQPGPCSHFPNSTGLSQGLQQSQPFQATIRSIVNLNLNSLAKHTDYKYSRQQLLELRSRTPVPRNFFLSLKDLGILRTRRVRAGVTAKQRPRRIPVVFGSERERTTKVYYSDQKLPYYHNVNKRSNLGSNAKNLIAVHRMSLKSLEICRKVNQLRLCSLNAQSLRNKTADFVCYAISSRADVFAVTETWFSERDAAHRAEATPLGFKLLDHIRDGRTGGGTALLVRLSPRKKGGRWRENLF